jgi:H+/Cl- antiporter ClcA
MVDSSPRSAALRDWFRAKLAAYKEMHPRFLSSLVMMGAAGASALVAIAYAKLMEAAAGFVEAFSGGRPWTFILVSPLWFGLSWALVRFFDPGAGGSGIPQLLAAIERSAGGSRSAPAVFHSVRLVAVKILSSFFATLGGGIIGREGPTIQISAAVFELFDGLFKKYVTSRRSREALLIAGGAAGLAAAFNTPLGGVVFAIEELASQHFKTFKGMLILSVVTAGYVTQAVLGPYLFIGHPSIGVVTVSETVIALAASLGIGVLGALFGVVLFRILPFVQGLKTLERLFLAAAIGVIMSSVCVLLGPGASGGGSLLIRKLLFGTSTEVAQVGWALAAWRTIGLVLTYLSGCAGGIFAPSLAAGAAVGAVLSQAFALENHNLIIVLSMIAFLTGATRSPFTCFILVFEMTDRQAAVMPMMAAALLANMAAKLVDAESFYERVRDKLLEHGKAADPPKD